MEHNNYLDWFLDEIKQDKEFELSETFNNWMEGDQDIFEFQNKKITY